MNTNLPMTQNSGVNNTDHKPALSTNDDLEDGELYVCKKGKLERIQRDESEGERKVRITDEAFEAAISIAKAMKPMLGWKPDLTLVISAVMIKRSSDEKGNQTAVRDFLVARLAQSESHVT